MKNYEEFQLFQNFFLAVFPWHEYCTRNDDRVPRASEVEVGTNQTVRSRVAPKLSFENCPKFKIFSVRMSSRFKRYALTVQLKNKTTRTILK